MQHWRITGNSNVAIQTGSTDISNSMTDIYYRNSDDTLTSHEIGSTAIRKLDPENIRSRCNFVTGALELEICLGVFFIFTPSPLPANVAKRPLPGEGFKHLPWPQPTSSTRNQLNGSCQLNRRALSRTRRRVARGTGRHRHYLPPLLLR